MCWSSGSRRPTASSTAPRADGSARADGVRRGRGAPARAHAGRPKVGRLALTMATQTSWGHVFMLYPGRGADGQWLAAALPRHAYAGDPARGRDRARGGAEFLGGDRPGRDRRGGGGDGVLRAADHRRRPPPLRDGAGLPRYDAGGTSRCPQGRRLQLRARDVREHGRSGARGAAHPPADPFVHGDGQPGAARGARAGVHGGGDGGPGERGGRAGRGDARAAALRLLRRHLRAVDAQGPGGDGRAVARPRPGLPARST